VSSFQTGAKQKPLLDEAGFEQLLAAAYVLQQHNDSLRADDSDVDPVSLRAEVNADGVTGLESELAWGTPVRGKKLDLEITAQAEICRVCGRTFGAGEEFCGGCGLPSAAKASPEDLQSKWASLWYMQQAQDTLREEQKSTESPPPGLPPRTRKAQAPTGKETGSERYREFAPIAQPSFADRDASQVSDPRAQHSGNSGLWNRATSTESEPNPTSSQAEPSQPLFVELGDRVREAAYSFLDRVRIGRRHSVAVAFAVLLFFVLVWGLWPASSSPKQLSWFESLLVELGLAEVPPTQTPTYSGNPNVRVWVDVHTALYYCPGSALYGKTPGGRFSKQRAAQEDQFEPASRVVCE